jgi:DNA-binding NtrC family response regulator
MPVRRSLFWNVRRSRIHVVFTDVHMPGPMDGLVLAHHVRRHWPSIGLLVASGRGNVDARAMPEGSRFIPKPYHLDHVVHHIRELRAPVVPFAACPRSAEANRTELIALGR